MMSYRLARPREVRLRSAPLSAVVAVCVILASFCGSEAAEPSRIPAAEAAHHVGEVAQVCGHVASAAYFASVKGGPTFLNLERPYPDQPFTVVIWGTSRSRFEGPPERLFDGKSICVTGRIETYRGKPQIVVEDSDQIVITSPEGGGGELSDIERILVKALLAQLGHETNYGTGEWDEHTVEAVIAFQEGSGLATTGEPDPPTLRALAAAVNAIPEPDRAMVIRLLLFEIVRRVE
jgi:hypothetical protein